MQQVGDETLFWAGKQNAEERDDVSSEIANGVNYLSLRPESFHYLVSEQARSMVALHELQNDVGELLEFRDLVIETFPNLCQKKNLDPILRSSLLNIHQPEFHYSHTSSKSHGSVTSPCSKVDKRSYSACRSKLKRSIVWEPGTVRKKALSSSNRNINNFYDTDNNGEKLNEVTSIPKCTSNSQKYGHKNSSAVQDSGFSTETSSKDSNFQQVSKPNTSKQNIIKQGDELWSLLDLIQKKGIILREEVEGLQSQLDYYFREDVDLSNDISHAIQKITNHNSDEYNSVEQNNILQLKKMQLLNKVVELETETMDSHARVQELQAKIESLSNIQNGLNNNSKRSLDNSNVKIRAISDTSPNKIHFTLAAKNSTNNFSTKNHTSAFTTAITSKNSGYNKFRHKSRLRPRISKPHNFAHFNPAINYNVLQDTKKKITKLGLLDSILVSPEKIKNVDEVPTDKIAAILKERSSLELQRQLITTTIHNQVLQRELNTAQNKNKLLTESAIKTKEENEDLRFQLVERNIELEGTRARVRILESYQQRPFTETYVDDERRNAYLPNIDKNIELESSAESSNVGDIQINTTKSSPRSRPSRIPLPGASSKTTSPKLLQMDQCQKNESKELFRSLVTRQNSLATNSSPKVFKTTSNTTKDIHRESFNKTPTTKFINKGYCKDLPNRSLTRINYTNKDSLFKPSYNQNETDQTSLDSNLIVTKKPPTSSSRSHNTNLNGRQSHSANDNEVGKIQSVKQFFWTTWLK